MPRNSYLNDDVLREVAGRLRYGASPLEPRLDAIPKPTPKPWSYPTHPLDKVAEEFGMRGFEFKALQEAAMTHMNDHALLKHYYKRFMMAAKLVLDGELEKIRQHERRQSEEKNKRDSSYQHKHREWESRTKQITKSWTQVRETARTRWNKIGRSIATLIEDDATLATMDPRDQKFLLLLEAHHVARIDHTAGRVQGVNWDNFRDMSIEDINQIILDLDASEAGGFIKKLAVVPLAEA